MKRQPSKKIFASALLELAKTEPLDSITVKQIVDASGLSLQTFYNHFSSKEDLIIWVHNQSREDADAKSGESNFRFSAMLMSCIHFYAENANYLRSSLGGSIVNPYAKMSADSAYEYLSRHICLSHNMDALSEELSFYLHMYIFSCLYTFSEWSFHGCPIDEGRLAFYLQLAMPEPLKPYLLNNP